MPWQRFCCVEMPGRVDSIDNAMRSIGGMSMLQKAVNNQGALRLLLNNKYKFQGPMTMQRQKCSDILVKGKKGVDGTWRYEVVGIIDVCFSLESLADFLFVPGEEYAFGESVFLGSSIEQELAGGAVAAPGPPYMPPAFFTRIDSPQVYDFEDNMMWRRSMAMQLEGASAQQRTSGREWIRVQQVGFKDKDVPTDPPEGIRESLTDEEAAGVAQLEGLFRERPIWLKQAIEAQFPHRWTVSQLQRMLQCVAFYWPAGPWRAAYMRLGFDPRLEPDPAAWLQVIDFRDKHLMAKAGYYERMKTGGAGSSARAGHRDINFRACSGKSSRLYQYKDIDDEMVQDILTAADHCTCNEKTGWWSEDTIKAVRERMSVKMHLIRAQGTSTLTDAPGLPMIEDNGRGTVKVRSAPTEEQTGDAQPQPKRLKRLRKVACTD